MKTHFIPCLKLTLITMLLFGVAYPLLITGIAKLTAANSGNGTTIQVNGKVVGFEVIGQSFKTDKYFNGRPSAVNYNAASTGGSNKGPTNPDYLAQVEARVQDFLSKNPGIDKKDIPVDLITASGGGLDPNISMQAAMVQVRRISKSRDIPEDRIRKLIDDQTETPLAGMFGTQRLNVLKLNIELDRITK